MKRLFFVSVMICLLVAIASISWAETTTVKGSKSNTSERMGGSGESQGKGTQPTPAPGPHSQQDPCENVKKDPKQYAVCQDAATPVGPSKRTGRRGGY